MKDTLCTLTMVSPLLEHPVQSLGPPANPAHLPVYFDPDAENHCLFPKTNPFPLTPTHSIRDRGSLEQQVLYYLTPPWVTSLARRISCSPERKRLTDLEQV